MLSVDDQERARVLAETQQLTGAIILQSRARLRGENYGAWRRAKTAVDVIGDIARAALVEKPLEAVDRVFVPRVGGACRGQYIARQNH